MEGFYANALTLSVVEKSQFQFSSLEIQKTHRSAMAVANVSLRSFSLLSLRSQVPSTHSSQISTHSLRTHMYTKSRKTRGVFASSASSTEAEVEVADGYTVTQFCDKIIDVFLNEKPKTKDWKRYMIFREEWRKHRDKFYNRCKTRAEAETDPSLKDKLNDLYRKVRKIDEDMEKHGELLKKIQDSPRDINAIVAKQRGDFTGDFFRYLTLLSETYDSLEDRDTISRLGARCLSAVSAFDNTLDIVGSLENAQTKFDDILDSPSIDVACEKIKSMAKANELDSSLILLINGAWASAKESATMKNEVKDIMYKLYKTTQSSVRSIMPKEIKLLKHLLNITDPEERFSALASSFSPGDESEIKEANATTYTTPKELHKWIKIMLDAYHLNKEETDIREARKMNHPIVIQRLFILKDTIEDEYLEKNTTTPPPAAETVTDQTDTAIHSDE